MVEISLAKVIKLERIVVLPKAGKAQVLDTLCDILGQTGEVTDPEDLRRGIYHRESLMSTGIGRGLGIPHVRLKSVSDIVAAVALVPTGIDDYVSMDTEPVKLVFMIAARDNQHAEHLRLLSLLSSSLKSDAFLKVLTSAPSPEALYQLLIEELR